VVSQFFSLFGAFFVVKRIHGVFDEHGIEQVLGNVDAHSQLPVVVGAVRAAKLAQEPVVGLPLRQHLLLDHGLNVLVPKLLHDMAPQTRFAHMMYADEVHKNIHAQSSFTALSGDSK